MTYLRALSIAAGAVVVLYVGALVVMFITQANLSVLGLGTVETTIDGGPPSTELRFNVLVPIGLALLLSLPIWAIGRRRQQSSED